MSKSRLDYNKSGSTGTISKLTKSYSSSVSQNSKSPPTVSAQDRKPATESEPPSGQKEGLVNKMVEEVKAVSPVMEESATEDEEALVIDKVRRRSFKI